MLQIIGFDGYAGCGKDTCAQVLIDRYGFVKVAFADALREFCSETFNLPMNMFLDRDLKEKPFTNPIILNKEHLQKFCDLTGYANQWIWCAKHEGTELVSPRHLLQFMGTQVGRHTLKDTIWLDHYVKRIQGLDRVVTPDARFTNERNLIKKMKGRVVWVEREGVTAPSSHSSENDKWKLDKYDVVVYNNRTIKDMKSDFSMWYSSVNKDSLW